MTTQQHSPAPKTTTAERLAPLIRFAVARLREPSSWRGIVLFLSGCGAAISPQMAMQIISVGVSLAGLIGMFMGADPTDPADPTDD
jgi:hypothetical protein